MLERAAKVAPSYERIGRTKERVAEMTAASRPAVSP